MLSCCSRCQHEFVALKRPANGPLFCNNCALFFQNKERQENKLGLHPVLEKHWQTVVSPAIPKSKATTFAYTKGIEQDVKNTSILKEKYLNLRSTPQINGYDIAYEIGRGAMGSVFKARKIKDGNDVAIKILGKDLVTRADLVARFEREIFALKSLKHKNIVTIMDSGHFDKTHYFAMEFIDGITLRTRLNRGNVSFEEAKFITTEILTGLLFAHKNGIIHRDLKPENVLLSYDNQDFSTFPSRVVLVDFGLVGIGGFGIDPHPNLTRSKVTMGTVNYMAPEQHIDAKRVDLRSDIYSCGVILFEMITGDLPIGRYLMPNERGLDVPLKIESILAKTLSRQPEDRYASCEEFLKELQSIPHSQSDSQTPQKNKINKMLSTYIKRPNNPAYLVLIIFSLFFFAFGLKIFLSKSKEVPVAAPMKENKIQKKK